MFKLMQHARQITPAMQLKSAANLDPHITHMMFGTVQSIDPEIKCSRTFPENR